MSYTRVRVEIPTPFAEEYPREYMKAVVAVMEILCGQPTLKLNERETEAVKILLESARIMNDEEAEVSENEPEVSGPRAP